MPNSPLIICGFYQLRAIGSINQLFACLDFLTPAPPATVALTAAQQELQPTDARLTLSAAAATDKVANLKLLFAEHHGLISDVKDLLRTLAKVRYRRYDTEYCNLKMAEICVLFST